MEQFGRLWQCCKAMVNNSLTTSARPPPTSASAERPSYRRQGVGRALMDAVRSAASERGITVFAEPA